MTFAYRVGASDNGIIVTCLRVTTASANEIFGVWVFVFSGRCDEISVSFLSSYFLVNL